MQRRLDVAIDGLFPQVARHVARRSHLITSSRTSTSPRLSSTVLNSHLTSPLPLLTPPYPLLPSPHLLPQADAHGLIGQSYIDYTHAAVSGKLDEYGIESVVRMNAVSLQCPSCLFFSPISLSSTSSPPRLW